MKKILSTIAAAAATGSLALCLVACGGNSTSKESAETNGATTEQTTDTKTESDSNKNDAKTEVVKEEAEDVQAAADAAIDYDTALDAVFAVCPIKSSQAQNIHVADKSGNYIVTFGSDYGDFSYTVDAKTGEITDKTEPDVPADATSSDPVELALDACFDHVGYNGGAENISTKLVSGGKTVNVQFDWNGTHYDMDYDVDTHKVTQN